MNDPTAARLPVLHPFLLAAYPVLALLAHNIEDAALRNAWRPLALSVILTLGLYGFLFLILRDRYKAGIAATIVILLLFSYGHVYEWFEGKAYIGEILGRHRFLVIFYLLLLVASLVWVIRKRQGLPRISYFLNLLTSIALIIPILQIGVFEFRLARARTAGSEQTLQNENISLKPMEEPRDVYYLILDGYARDDILKKFYQFDNHPFLDRLTQLGFFVGACSLSNYAQTQLSLASSLNLNYLASLGEQYKAGNTSRIGLADLIQHSKARKIFESLGYTVIAFDTGYDATRWKDVDHYFAPQAVQDIDDFEELFIRTTAARLIVEGVALLDIPPNWEKRDQLHRERILFTLDRLNNQVLELPGPKFVFAHIISPHWPHVFGPHGEAVHEHNDSLIGYRNQVEFINTQIVSLLTNLITKSSKAPVIIIQGDHGSVIESPQQRMSILNAYYLPGQPADILYEKISPVNTFRLIFNSYFNGNFDLLEDRSYYSRYESPYEYQIYQDTRPGCASNP